ncbi:MAG: hypothetical protein WBV85_14550 [Solirubrobacteraceae bacterium]
MATTPSSNARSGHSAAHLVACITALVCAMVLGWGAVAQAALTRPYTGQSFGPDGQGAGEFSSVGGVAVERASGDVLVYDNDAKGSVYKFDSSGNPVNFTSLATNRIEGVGRAGHGETEIAVDNSTGPDAGDIYVANNSVVRIYSGAGQFLGELTGGEMCGVAVDSAGAVYVGVYGETVRKYAPVSNPVTNTDEVTSMGGLHDICNVAVDSAGNVYAATYSGGVTRYEAMQFGLLEAMGTTIDASGRTLSVGPVNDDLYANSDVEVVEYDSSGTPLSSSGSGELHGSSFGVAVSNDESVLYVPRAGRIGIYGTPVVLPDPVTEKATEIHNTSAVLNGSVNPEGTPSTYQFEYGTEEAYGSLSPATPASAGSGSTPHAVSTELTGLAPDTVYHYRLVSTNANGANRGADMTFRATGPPQAVNETFSGVGATEAQLNAGVRDFGDASTYRYEYGTTASYGSSTSSSSLGASEEEATASMLLSGLQPGITYHFRIVLENAHGASEGPDVVFTTLAPAASSLPDGRVYEMVTPPNKENANVYIPDYIDEISTSSTFFPFQVSPDGSRVTYSADPTTGGNGKSGGGGGNLYLATRSAAGWSHVNTQPSGDNGASYQAFDEDLSTGFFDSCAKRPVSPLAPAGFDDLYEYSVGTGQYTPLVTSTPPNRSKASFGASGFLLDSTGCRQVAYAGSSTNGAHVVFEANDALIAQAATSPPGEEENDIYDSVNGQLSLVNVLPSGAVDPNAAVGSVSLRQGFSTEGFDFHRAVSADGSRIFWTDLKDGNLYVREDSGTSAARTVQVDGAVGGGGHYVTANKTGSLVFFSKAGDLYAFDTGTEQTADLAPAGQVLGVVDISDDGSYVYFVAEAALAPGANAGEPNLYLVKREGVTWGAPRFVTTLAHNDAPQLGNEDEKGVWSELVGQKVAESTPDGHTLVFQSDARLTGYDSLGAPEVYVYDADSGQIACASCNPSGEEPGAEQLAFGGEQLLPISNNDEYQLRWVSADGSRVFFNGSTALVPNDVNGRQDVYEWERQGAGGCEQVRGCISLLSGGTSTVGSYLINIGANGDDVFIVTRAQLVEADQNENLDLYDVRAGGVQPVSAPVCTGAGCQGVPPAPPTFATPSSVTFNGVGNFAQPAKARAKTRSKALTKSQRLGSALKACAKKPKRKRAACRSLARKRYAAQVNTNHAKSIDKGAKRHA